MHAVVSSTQVVEECFVKDGVLDVVARHVLFLSLDLDSHAEVNLSRHV